MFTLHFENAFPNILEKTVSAFKNGAKDVANAILMELIFAIKKQNENIKDLKAQLESEPGISLDLDTEEFHENMLNVIDMLEKLVAISDKNKDKSEIFNQMHNISKEMYENATLMQIELSFVASEQRYKESSALAS
jgi:molecular chaperone GrpE (heat shock protein)